MKENPNKQKYTRVPLPIRVPQELKNELAEAAKAKGISRTAEAEQRLKNKPVMLTPELLVNLQDKANVRYNELKYDQPDEADRILKEVYQLWKSLS